MKPLYWPASFYEKPEPPRTFWDELWARLPVLAAWRDCPDYEAVIAEIGAQLLQRDAPDSGVWGTDALRIETARYLCALLREEYDWPNDYFLPDDPSDIAFQMPWDDLQIVELMLQIEEDLIIEIADAEVENWGESSTPLGDVVDLIVTKRNGTQPAP